MSGGLTGEDMFVLWPIGAIAIAAWATWAIWRSRSKLPDKPNGPLNVVLRDGREYVVGFDETQIWIARHDGERTNELRWADLTSVYALAIDRFPIGSISWMLHGANKQIAEVPTDAEGAMDLFKAMQSRLQGFDNRAAIESASMAHGFRKLWPGS
jgi:hypothetical protein